MPRFYFDLYFDRYVVLDPGGMPFEHNAGAQVAALQMARDLAIIHSELRNGRGWIRVRDERRHEIQRFPIDVDPDSAWSMATREPTARVMSHSRSSHEEDPSNRQF
ncbi:DUF6894 family protein [Bradyrhizobium sp. HKCCYLS1011]|uniref:DUF6894 family protein n=1 Tax=Bradyrhizobium sp. HKCCYLS1011 TaxID=3420733 RepID=UPI003EB73BC6